MQHDTRDLLISAIGPILAILLGMVLVPFRTYTSASNFTFLFLILTILIAEYGGRRAAFATALCSALSLDFFLTQPYMQLMIKSSHDIAAFGGLALCGFLVATFGAQRGEKALDLTSAREQLDLLHSAVSGLADATQVEFHLRTLLDAASGCAPLEAAAIRDENNHTLAALADGADPTAIPIQILSPYTLFPRGSDTEYPQNLPLPKEGARIPLLVENRQVGWLDLWGKEAQINAGVRRTLSDVAFLLGRMLEIRSQTARRSLQPA